MQPIAHQPQELRKRLEAQQAATAEALQKAQQTGKDYEEHRRQAQAEMDAYKASVRLYLPVTSFFAQHDYLLNPGSLLLSGCYLRAQSDCRSRMGEESTLQIAMVR